MDLSISPEAEALAEKTREFIESQVLPLEEHLPGTPPTAALESVRRAAREAGLWAPQLPASLGGRGLTLLEAAPVLEAAGRSLLGPLALGCSAPDEGNAHLLDIAATEAQREAYLFPLARGEMRSAFAMTEPPPGAGSDPTMMRSRAVKDGDDWVIDAHKWFSTGAAGAAFAIVACVTDAEARPREAMTLFLVDANTPGYEIVREVPTLGDATPGGHCEVKLAACRVHTSQILGEVGQGYRLMQKRLGPARLTHCMRWLGVAARSLDIAIERAQVREAFGKTLGEHQAIAWMLADSATEIEAARLLTRAAAWRVARGEKARVETSQCKVFVAETVGRVIDRAIQVCGAAGMSTDLPLAQFSQEARAFRIYDGPSEVHRMVIARELLGRRGGR